MIDHCNNKATTNAIYFNFVVAHDFWNFWLKQSFSVFTKVKDFRISKNNSRYFAKKSRKLDARPSLRIGDIAFFHWILDYCTLEHNYLRKSNKNRVDSRTTKNSQII